MMRSGLLTVCFLIFFPPSLLADSVHSFTYRADSFSNNLFDFTAADHDWDGGDSAFFVSGTFGSKGHHLKWLDDPENDHGEAWGWRRNHHHHDGDDPWNFEDQGDEDTDGDSGNSGGTSSGERLSTSSVPEPSGLVLLSIALAAFLLKSLRSVMD